MKKILIAFLLVLLTVGLVVSCNGDVNQIMVNNSWKTKEKIDLSYIFGESLGIGIPVELQLDILNNHELSIYLIGDMAICNPAPAIILSEDLRTEYTVVEKTWYAGTYDDFSVAVPVYSLDFDYFDDSCCTLKESKNLKTFVVKMNVMDESINLYLALSHEGPDTFIYIAADLGETSIGLRVAVEPTNRIVWQSEKTGSFSNDGKYVLTMASEDI